MYDYDWVTDEMFDAKLQEILCETKVSELISIPGVYEAVAEHFNNRILEELEEEREV